MQNLEHLRILPVIFPIYHSLGSSLGNALQLEQPHLRKKILLDTLFQAPPMFTRCCRKHAREIKHFLKSKLKAPATQSLSHYFIHSENSWAKKSALRPESAIFIGCFNVSIRGKIWSSFFWSDTGLLLCAAIKGLVQISHWIAMWT